MEHRCRKYSEFRPALRGRLPSFQWDFYLWCRYLDKTINKYPPDAWTVREIVNDITYRRVPQSKASDVSRDRLYIIDANFHIPLIICDSDGVIADKAQSYAQGNHWRDFDVIDDVCSDSYFPDTVGTLTYPFLVRFKEYEMYRIDPLTFWQALLLVQRYQYENVVDWHVALECYDVAFPV